MVYIISRIIYYTVIYYSILIYYISCFLEFIQYKVYEKSPKRSKEKEKTQSHHSIIVYNLESLYTENLMIFRSREQIHYRIVNSWLAEEAVCRNGKNGRFETVILEEHKATK